MNIEKTPLSWFSHGARYYDPQLSLWHTPDPLSESTTSLSPYAYVANNPVNFVDPNGMYYAKGPSPLEREYTQEGRGLSYISGHFWNLGRPEFQSNADAYFLWYQVKEWANSLIEATPEDGSMTIDITERSIVMHVPVIGTVEDLNYSSINGYLEYTYNSIEGTLLPGKITGSNYYSIDALTASNQFQDKWADFPIMTFANHTWAERTEHMLYAIKYAMENTYGIVNINKVFRGINYIESSKGGTAMFSSGHVQVNIDDRMLNVQLSYRWDVDLKGNIRNPNIPFGGGQEQLYQQEYNNLYWTNYSYGSWWNLAVGTSTREDHSDFDFLLSWIGWH